ncbi:MAG: hypothetical protein EAX86_05975 [Candidatus Heimdallarchaeota archaeon]|nr:hypothetical protein [Candidatus Heimdallarchaeota archaeon]
MSSSEYETKIVCDGPCRLCKHQREKDIKSQGKDLVYYCRSCQQKYFCKDVLGRDRSEFTCPACNSTITEMTVERAQQMGLAFSLRLSRTKVSKRPVEQIKRTWFYSTGIVMLSRDFVTDLITYEELDVPHIIDLMFHSDLQILPGEKRLEKKELLWDIFAKKPGIIRSIHNSLITRSENRRVDLIVRTLTKAEVFGCEQLSSIISDTIAGTVDLIGIDKETGGLVWFVCQENRVDEQIVNSILNELLSLPPLEFMSVERIILLTPKWIWMGAEIARRQGRILTRWRRIQIELWEENSLYQYKRI